MACRPFSGEAHQALDGQGHSHCYVARDAVVDVAATRQRVLSDLQRQGVTSDHQLVAEHSVVMDPAYVHITRASLAEHARLAAQLRQSGVYAIGRYGGWTYCSIEDNIVEARQLVSSWGA